MTRRSTVVTLAIIGVLAVIGGGLQRYGLGGLAVDHAAVREWLSGGDLYAYRSPARLGSAVPPITALLLAPLAALPLAVAGWLLALAGAAALLLAIVALTAPVARRYGRSRGATLLAAGALVLITEPVRATLGLGHLDLVVFGLVVADVVALRRAAWARRRAAWWPGRPASHPGHPRGALDVLRRGWATGGWAGAGIGVAAALAAGPVLFILYLAVTRQWRATLTALGVAGTLTLAALLAAPATSVTWLGTVSAQVDRGGPVNDPANQSLAGVLARLYDSAGTPVLVWLSFAGLLLAVGLIRARSAHADGDEITAFTLVGLTAAVVSPVSRTHELIWALPAVLVMIDAAARRRLAVRRPRPRRLAGAGCAAAAVLVYLVCTIAPQWTLRADVPAFALIVLLNALPWRPGAAPALPVVPRPGPRPAAERRPAAIPGPRGS